MKKKTSNKIECGDCGRKFGNQGAFTRHQMAMHPYIPPPAPKVTTVHSDGTLDERTLLGGINLEIGDVFYRVEKHVVKRITKTEGSRDVKVLSEVTKSYWTSNKPQ